MTAPGQPLKPAGRGSDTPDPLNSVKLLVAWAIVGIPLAWGVWKVVLSALKLFK
jgi:uncharacterized membrane protein